jgi:transcription initiation factor TFIIB
VITAQELDRGPQRYSDEESTPRTGAPRTVARHDRGLSTKIGTDRDGKGRTLSTGKRRQLRRLRREHRRGNVGSKRERNERHGLMEIRRLASALEVPEAIRDRACSLFQTAQREDLLRGRSIESMAAASAYAACRLAELPRTLEEVASHTTYSVAELRQRFGVLNVELGLSVAPLSPSDYVPRFASELDVPIDVRHRALELARCAEDSGLANGAAPSGVAAACLSVAVGERDYSLTQGTIAGVANVSATTIRTHREPLVGRVD